MLSLAWKDWERKASNFPPEVAFQLYSFHWARLIFIYTCSHTIIIDLATPWEIHDETDNIHLNAEPSHVIIHTGTNNLPSESVDSYVRKIQKLALKAHNKF